jgi:hypothetical protein
MLMNPLPQKIFWNSKTSILRVKCGLGVKETDQEVRRPRFLFEKSLIKPYIM